MKDNAFIALIVPVILAVFVVSCSKPEPPPEETPPPPPPKITFSIAATNVVVTEEEIPKVAEQKRVEADFNQDNRLDVAVVEEKEDGENTLSIYLRTERQNEMKTMYYQSGGVRMLGEFDITALLSAGGGTYADLIVIQVYHSDSRKEMIHFRTEGQEFKEISRETIN